MHGFGDGHRLADRDRRPAEKLKLAVDRLLVGRSALLGPVAERGWLAGRRRYGIDRGREDDRHQGGCKQLSPTSRGTHACSLHLEPVSAGARAGSSRKKMRPTPWRYMGRPRNVANGAVPPSAAIEAARAPLGLEAGPALRL